jgi:hypothetical protein
MVAMSLKGIDIRATPPPPMNDWEELHDHVDVNEIVDVKIWACLAGFSSERHTY